ncbi:MAG: LysR family transcriptional regulator [Magnetococcales bacterium]|nr:LysR family transcriptional regulator [Magnetococcales bacterium]MBF0629422.1 LysR family transcriptional regulator [Magnetococcales bacterium]
MRVELQQFDMNLLLAFETLFIERGVTRAGNVLGITQAAMSNTLRRLRTIFNDPLFVKDGTRMEPTALALELSGPVSAALWEMRQILEVEDFNPATSRTVFRLGVVDYSAAVLIPALIECLQVESPHVSVELIDIGGEDEARFLESGEVDLIFSRFQNIMHKESLKRLYEMHYVCLHRPGHPLVHEGTLTLEAFLQAGHVHYYPKGMVTTVVDEALAHMGASRRIVARMFSLSLVPFIVQSSDLLAVVPEGVARFVAGPLNLSIAPLPIETPPLRIAVAWHRRTENSAQHIWLRQQILSVLEKGSATDNSGIKAEAMHVAGENQ